MFSEYIQLVLFSLCLTICVAKLNPHLYNGVEEISFTRLHCTNSIDYEPMPVWQAPSHAFKWSNVYKKCIRVNYDIGNTPNNFETLEECKRIAEPVCKAKSFHKKDCKKSVYQGPDRRCRAFYFTVFTWNNVAQKCEPALYVGCNGSPNVFSTFQECQSITEPVCKVPEFSENDCYKKVHLGKIRCKGYSEVFTWNNKKNRCVPAIYDGCYGFKNMFKNLDDCRRVATPICTNYRKTRLNVHLK